MSTVTKEQLDEWQALCEEASPRPWEASNDFDVRLSLGDDSIFVVHSEFGEGTWAECDRAEDAAFIAAARSALPKLIAEVRRLRKVLSSISLDCTVPGCDSERPQCQSHSALAEFQAHATEELEPK